MVSSKIDQSISLESRYKGWFDPKGLKIDVEIDFLDYSKYRLFGAS